MSESTQTKKHAETPLMKQYNSFKAKYPGALLLFRIGDFYETFGEDAIIASRVLGIALTRRANGSAADIELAGFPHHSVDNYLPRLVRGGYRVAICEQLEDPKQAKGIVKRGVTEVVSPGIAMHERMLDNKCNNYLAAIHFSASQPEWAGCAFVDVSTGDFFCSAGEINTIEKLMYSLEPAEVLVSRKEFVRYQKQFGEDFYLQRLEDWIFDRIYAEENLCKLFQTVSLKGFGVDDLPDGITAAGVLVHYLISNEQKQLQHLSRLYALDTGEYLIVDRFTLRNLELLQPLQPDGVALIDVLDQTKTPMGARLLRRHICFPLRNLKAIEQRQNMIETLVDHPERVSNLQSLFKSVGDPERWLARLSTRKISPRECTSLRQSLQMARKIADEVNQWQEPAFGRWRTDWSDLEAPYELLVKSLGEDCPHNLNQGGYIRNGFSEDLDKIRRLRNNSESILEEIRDREAERTGIASLKIKYNRVFGYYIEITNTNKDKVPSNYIRKQTLTNAERYITPELKELEERILQAEDEQQELEQKLYDLLLTQLLNSLGAMQTAAKLLAELDVSCNWAFLARNKNYVRPLIVEEPVLILKEARHAVIESLLPPDRPYIPNDLNLNTEDEQILIITGPNMAGKSAALRQTGLIVLMAQMGGWVPAHEATIGWVDRLFTRVGASDNQALGESTFMVEMNESARILNNASPRSLILLDEVGRGTSTFDGVSIAWAMVEYLHEQSQHAARTLFATHYHELAALAEQYPRIHNYNVAVREVDGKILFLRKLMPGSSAHSFGIQVAEMAGMPPQVVQRARELLPWFEEHLARSDQGIANAIPRITESEPQIQLRLFQVEDETGQRIRLWLNRMDLERMTPMDAMMRLIELKKLLDEN